MDVDELTISAQRLSALAGPLDLPLAFVDLDCVDCGPDDLRLPPCPVIGIGPLGHPLGLLLDAVVEPPVSSALLARQVQAHPRAAAVLVQLLRVLPELSPQQGLIAESLAYAALQGSAEHAAWLGRQETAPVQPAGRLDMRREEDRLVLTLDRPAAGNAIDRILRDSLGEALAMAVLDETVTSISLRAAGRTFCLGADLAEFGTTRDPATAHAIRMATLPAHQLARCADRLDVHVQGGCVGAGLEMAAWARWLTAAPNAWFQLPELAMGIIPGAGGCVSLARRLGRQRTALLALSGKRLSARQALDWWLIDAIVDQSPGDDRSADVAG